jgi:hypothetical protein
LILQSDVVGDFVVVVDVDVDVADYLVLDGSFVVVIVVDVAVVIDDCFFF